MGALGQTVCLLEVEPDLAADLDEDELEIAQRNSVVRLLTLTAGRWSPSAVAAAERGGVGLLVLEGACLRREAFAGRARAEPLGEGDLIRRDDEEWEGLPTDVYWEALSTLHLAILDRRFAARMAVFPSVVDRLVDRLWVRLAACRQRELIAANPGLPDRLLLTLRQLVNRYGRATADGFVLPWRLSQGDLAQVIGVSRQSVNDAVQLLRHAGILEQRTDRSWWLSRGPDSRLPSLVELPSPESGGPVDHQVSAG